ncbi:MAG: DNA-directed RNA polymerase subunit D [Candidatus Methanosuratincola petrocarbonis]|nr:DNA-directed RNA polymerase subunit D [Candidatus Methanosuratincola sp.]
MDVEVLGNVGARFRIITRGADPSFINAIRRTVMAEVTVPAVDKVFIAENSGVLYDEILAHRIGLVPLKGGEGLVRPSECDCGGKGCPRCEAILTLEVEAPEDAYTVYSGRLKPEGSVFVANNDIPIAVLNKGQKIALEAHARLGSGKEHAKWQPVSGAVVKYEPIITIDAKKCSLSAKCVQACPKKILVVEGGVLKVTSVWDCTLCKECVDACPNGAISVSYNPANAMLTLESEGSLSPQELIFAACDVLKDKFESIRIALENTKEAS